jgi:hypothetical protein
VLVSSTSSSSSSVSSSSVSSSSVSSSSVVSFYNLLTPVTSYQVTSSSPVAGAVYPSGNTK